MRATGGGVGVGGGTGEEGDGVDETGLSFLSVTIDTSYT